MNFLVTYTEGSLVKVIIFSNIQRVFTHTEDGWLEYIIFENFKGKQEKFNCTYILKVELIK